MEVRVEYLDEDGNTKSVKGEYGDTITIPKGGVITSAYVFGGYYLDLEMREEHKNEIKRRQEAKCKKEAEQRRKAEEERKLKADAIASVFLADFDMFIGKTITKIEIPDISNNDTFYEFTEHEPKVIRFYFNDGSTLRIGNQTGAYAEDDAGLDYCTE